jgi:hypothetical protein
MTRTCWLSALCLLVWAFVSSPAFAETFMTVGDVPVDVTAKNAAEARDEAIAQAQQRAFDRLVKRLVPNPADQARIKPSLQEVEGMVQDFAIENERVSPVRYIGLYSVRFRAGRVRKYLADAGINSVGDLQQVMIVPVYQGAAGAALWGQSNPWRTAWQRGGFGDGPVSLILPNGDSFDTATLSAGAAEAGDPTAINAMIQRYHVAGIVIATAEPHDSGRGAASGLTVTATIYDGTGLKGAQTVTVAPAAGEQPDKLLLRGVAATAQALEDQWKGGSTGLTGYVAPPADPNAQADLQTPITAGTLYPVQVRITGLRGWVGIRDKLGAVGGVQHVSLDAMTREGAAITIDFAGDAAALQSALVPSGYVLVQSNSAPSGTPGQFELREATPQDAVPASAPPQYPGAPYPAGPGAAPPVSAP